MKSLDLSLGENTLIGKHSSFDFSEGNTRVFNFGLSWHKKGAKREERETKANFGRLRGERI